MSSSELIVVPNGESGRVEVLPGLDRETGKRLENAIKLCSEED